jgi:phosphatidylserine/phosphatidylglycerophosphate/cardiolipin synthase-like enzyme
MPTDPEVLYRQLGQLVAEAPADLFSDGPISADTHRWLGRASVLVAEASTEVGDMMDPITFTVASNGLGGILRHQNAHEVVAVLHRALARAEALAPAAARGAFIPVGAEFDILQVLSKVIGTAKTSALIVDPYMDSKALTDFAMLAEKGVSIRLLSDSKYTDPAALVPPASRWIKQYGTDRPLEVRQTSPRALHDRLIIIDDHDVWALSQSLKDFVGRSPATVLRVEGEPGVLKREAYVEIWAQASVKMVF